MWEDVLQSKDKGCPMPPDAPRTTALTMMKVKVQGNLSATMSEEELQQTEKPRST